MKTLFPIGTILVGVWLGAAPLDAAEPTTARARTPDPKPAPAPKPVEVPKSVFMIPASLAEGRNPFFPESKAVAPLRTNLVPTASLATGLVLNGITSPPLRTAMINGRTFEAGEKGDIRFSGGGKVSVTCIEIRDTSVIVEIAGERKELKLRSGL